MHLALSTAPTTCCKHLVSTSFLFPFLSLRCFTHGRAWRIKLLNTSQRCSLRSHSECCPPHVCFLLSLAPSDRMAATHPGLVSTPITIQKRESGCLNQLLWRSPFARFGVFFPKQHGCPTVGEQWWPGMGPGFTEIYPPWWTLGLYPDVPSGDKLQIDSHGTEHNSLSIGKLPRGSHSATHPAEWKHVALATGSEPGGVLACSAQVALVPLCRTPGPLRCCGRLCLHGVLSTFLPGLRPRPGPAPAGSTISCIAFSRRPPSGPGV